MSSCHQLIKTVETPSILDALTTSTECGQLNRQLWKSFGSLTVDQTFLLECSWYSVLII